jgi:hypothetical protein
MQDLWFSTSKIVNHVKARLGASVRGLELDNDAIAKVLKEETLPTLSIYFPKFIGYIVDTKEDIVDNQRGLFYINTPTTLIGAELILSMSTLGQSGAYDFYDRSFQICPHEFVLAWLQAEVSGFSTIPYSCELVPPNKIRVTPIPPSTNENKIALKLKVAHSDFTEFPPGLRETIFKLARCDVKLDILGLRTVFTNLNVSMADIELGMGTFEQAESERDALLEKIRGAMHLSANRRKVWCQ